MKRIISTLFIILLACIGAKADFVSEQQAREIAERWFPSGELSLSLNGQQSIWYINNSQGGWILLSADDSTSPVLGYNDEGSIHPDNLVPQLKAWLGDCEKGILQARERKIAASDEIKLLWKMAGTRTKAASGKLLQTASWGQDSPFNDLCPTVTEKGSKKKSITGCVATAMAIVCRYHEWPAQGSGTVGGYSYKGDFNNRESIPSVDISSHTYDYSLMPLEYKSSSSSQQCSAVAQLMVDVGYAAELSYGYEYGTAGFTSMAIKALHEHFGYRGDVSYVSRDSYDDGLWIEMMCEEIDKGNPIIYGAVDSSEEGGHQFICDGYDSKRYLHINWGWDGVDNGYFDLSLRIPGSYTFSLMQDAVLGLEPDREASSPTLAGDIQYYYDSSNQYSDMSISKGDLFSGWTCSAYFMNIMSEYTYSGKIRAALIDWQGNLKEVLSSEKSLKIASYAVSDLITITANAASNPAPGDRAVLQYLFGNEWKTIMPCDKTVQSWCLPAVDMPLVICQDNYTSGDEFILELVPGSKAISSYTWYLDNSKQSFPVVKSLSSGKHTIKVVVKQADGSSITLQKTISVN